MVSFPAAILACALVSSGETALYEFKADWCAPCQQMAPTVRKLADAGYPIREVNIDQDRETTERFGVGPLPCYVLVVDGQEVDRVVGLVSQSELEGMFARAKTARPSAGLTEVADRRQHQALPARASAASDPFVAVNASQPESAAPSLLASTVRLRIEDPTGQSFGSGTVIDSRNGEALIVTCGHVFRESQGKGKISVDLFGPGAPQGLPGQVIGYDLERDLGFVAIRTGVDVASAHVAAANATTRIGDPVSSVGCNGGAEPTVMSSQVTAIDKYLGPPNIQAAGLPVQGRSGGGLFNARCELIGVCNAADPEDNEGLYAAIGAIHAELDRLKLSSLVRPASSTVAPPASAAVTLASHTELVDQPVDRRREAEAAAAIADHQGAEVICIVRSLNDPRAKSDVIVLDRASPEFLSKLAAEHSVQENRQLTGLKRREATGRTENSSAWRPSNARSTRKIALGAKPAMIRQEKAAAHSPHRPFGCTGRVP